VFSTQPGNGFVGAALGTQPAVTVLDAGGNTVSASSASVSLVLSPAGATLVCTANPLAASAGVAPFEGCAVNSSGTYSLIASSPGLGSTNSATFAVAISYAVGGSVSGLGNGKTVVLQNNAGDDLTVSANGAFTFATALASGGNYAVTIKTQPTGQTCAVTSGSGTVATANVTNVSVTCTTNTYTVGGSVSGLGTGKTVVLQNNAGDDLTVSANGSFTFATATNAGNAYAVTVKTQPSDQLCEVVQGTGIATANVTGITVQCFVTSAAYPTRGGPVRVAITGGTCAGFEEATVGFRDPVGAPASAGVFPYGALGFTVKSCGPGGTVRITMFLPNQLPPGTRYWKQLPSGWVDWTDRVQMQCDRIILTLTDWQ
jgi:hypothetical protein